MKIPFHSYMALCRGPRRGGVIQECGEEALILFDPETRSFHASPEDAARGWNFDWNDEEGRGRGWNCGKDSTHRQDSLPALPPHEARYCWDLPSEYIGHPVLIEMYQRMKDRCLL